MCSFEVRSRWAPKPMARANANLVPGTGNPRAAAMARSRKESEGLQETEEDI